LLVATADRVELRGFDAVHLVDGMLFEHVVVNRRPLAHTDGQGNDFLQNIRVGP